MAGLHPNFESTLKALGQIDEPNRVSDEYFINTLLPRIAGVGNPIPLNEWHKLAGGYYNPLLVVRPDGSVRYTIPPILNRVETVVDTQRNVGMDAVLHEAQNIQQISEEGAANLIYRAFEAKFDTNTRSQTLSNIEMWNGIFKEHGYPIIDLTDLKEDATDISNEPEADEVSGLDDFDEI